MKRLLCLPVLFLCLGVALGQDKKPDKKDTPRVVVTAPLGIPAGVPTKLSIRGLKLDTATEVRFSEEKVTVKVLSKSKVPVPNQQDPNKIGDSQLEVEVTLPADPMPETLSFVVVTPAGESPAHRLLLNGEPAPVAEKKPNHGFRQAQPIQVPQVIDGTIRQPQEVSVFRIDGQQGQRLVCEVLAARHGSPLDSILTLYNSRGVIVASNDDHGDSTDSLLEVTLPQTDTYYLSLSDAHDQGGPSFVYRLVVKAGK